MNYKLDSLRSVPSYSNEYVMVTLINLECHYYEMLRCMPPCVDETNHWHYRDNLIKVSNDDNVFDIFKNLISINESRVSASKPRLSVRISSNIIDKFGMDNFSRLYLSVHQTETLFPRSHTSLIGMYENEQL